MESGFLNFFLAFCVGMILATLFLSVYFFRRIGKIRKQAIKQSKSVILGEVSEKMLPIFPNFPYHSKDLVFVGKGIDYIVFDGLSEGNLREIVFLEVKSGKSQLNTNERMIQRYLSQDKVRYELIHINY